MKIIRKRIADMNRAAYNPRVELKPGDEEYEALTYSIEKFGLVEPVVWNSRTNNIVGGHQRLTVLENLGQDEVDVSVVDLDERKEKELNIALNKISGYFDNAKLADILQELGEQANETGFTLPETEQLQNDINGLIDDTFINKELARLDATFNLSLKFNAADKKDLNAYVKEYGKETIIQIILEKIRGDM